MLSVLKNISFADKQVINLVLNVIPMPIQISPVSGVPMVCRPGPKFYIIHKPVFDGIVVDVIYVSLQIGFISNLVFPEPPLPYTALPSARSGNALGRFMAARG
jgi:hypothetical protein